MMASMTTCAEIVPKRLLTPMSTPGVAADVTTTPISGKEVMPPSSSTPMVDCPMPVLELIALAWRMMRTPPLPDDGRRPGENGEVDRNGGVGKVEHRYSRLAR